MTLDELRQKRDLILGLAAEHGAANVRVFGSVARGEARPESDVDFLIDVVDPSKFSWSGGGLLVDLGRLLGCPVDLVLPDEVHWYIRECVLAEAVPL
jgi:predicted nucleotidyltransferase